MNKQDLKPGMYVEHRNGEVEMVVQNYNGSGKTYLIDGVGHVDLDNFNNDLEYERPFSFGKDTQWDIMKVYPITWDINFTMEKKPLWVRKDNTEEIEKVKKEIAEAQASLKNAQEKLSKLEDK